MDNTIESAIKKIFLECIKDPQITESLKKKLLSEDKTYELATPIKDKCEIEELEADNNSIDKINWDEIVNKLDKLLKNQSDIMGFFESGGGQGNDKASSFFSSKTKRDQKDAMISLKEHNKKLEVQVQKITCDLELEKNEKEALRKENQDILNRFRITEKLLNVWENIKILSDDSKNYICQLCGSDEFYALVSLGRDEEKITQLWNYLRDQTVKCDADEKDVEIINDFFEFCIEVANSSKMDEDKFSFYEPMVDAEYDMESCIKTFDSRQIGNVKEIIIRGVKQNEKVIFKSIVRID